MRAAFFPYKHLKNTKIDNNCLQKELFTKSCQEIMSSMFNYESGVIVILLNKRKDIEKVKKKRKNECFTLCGIISITGKNLSKLRIENLYFERKNKNQVRAIYSSFRPKESTT